MLDLYSHILRSVLTESEEDSMSKYQKDVDAVKKLGEFIEKNEDKFKKDFFKYFYEKNGLKDTNNSDNSSQEEYQKTGVFEVGWYFVDYIFKLLGQDPNEKDTRISKYGDDSYTVYANTYINLPFVSFDVKASLRITPSKSNKPGKKFVFDLDLDESDMYLWVDDTQDKNFKIPDEDQIDILKYRDYDYKNNKKNAADKKGAEDFKSKYVNSSTERFVGMTAYAIKEKQGEVKTKSEVEKFNITVLKAVMKHTKLTPKSDKFETSSTYKWLTTHIFTTIGGLYIQTYLAEGEFSYLEKVSLYPTSEAVEDIVLYDAEHYNKN